MAELKTHKSRIGKGLINMLMFQMYGDEKLIYREYVQNARDAINDAVNHGILGAITDGRISITIDSAKRFIEIRDNGIGIPVERVESVLLDIADSNKDGESSAGQFGIGRLVGGYFCKKLSFRTTYKGEEFASEIVFDIDKIKAILNDENDKRDATDVIDSASSRNLYDENKDDHYFIVTLCNIDLQYPALLNKDIIADYLREVAPVDYSAQFRNQLIMTSVSGEYEELSKYIVMENVLLLEIKQLYDSLVAAPYGEYVHGYGTQKPNGFKYKSNAQTLFNKVVELNEKCRPSYIDEQTIFQLSHTLEKEVEHVVGTYEEAIKPNAAQKRWQELDDKMNRATRQIHLDIYSLLSYIEETSHE